jgi:hypothetical protein
MLLISFPFSNRLFNLIFHRGDACFSPHERAILEAIAEACLPPGNRVKVDLRQTGALEAAEQMIAATSELERIGLKFLLWSFDLTALIATPEHRPFTRLSLPARMRYLERWYHSRTYASRAGIRSILALLMIHYYDQSAVRQALGFCERQPISPWPEDFIHDH